MLSEQILADVKKRLVSLYHPDSIYIFGSHAWGTPDDESDLDLLIVVEKLTNKRHAMKVLAHKELFDINVSKDILIYTKDEFIENSQHQSCLAYKVKNHGKQIYAKA